MSKLFCGDCLAIMPILPPASVDLILCDLPYGQTSCAWDTIIPLAPLWKAYSRVLKPNGTVLLTSSQPFTSVLNVSNLEAFRYEWIWRKNKGSNFQNVKRQPFKEHETVSVFYWKQPTYNPQMQERTASGLSRIRYKFSDAGVINPITKLAKVERGPQTELRSPSSVQRFNCEMGLHPTQKPVALFEYLIRTHSNEGDTVLDNCMGSGTAGVAAGNAGRNFIGIEQDEEIFAGAARRIGEADAKRANRTGLFQ